MRFYEALEPEIFVLRLIPGMRAEDYSAAGWLRLQGHHPRKLRRRRLPGGDDGPLFAAVRDWCAAGRLAVFTTQVPHEGSDLGVYEVGRAAKALDGVIEARDMTPEAAAVKLMWALGQSKDRAEVARLFLMPVQFDLA